MITRDFNAILKTDDRINGNVVSTYEMIDFQQFLDDADMAIIILGPIILFLVELIGGLLAKSGY